MRAVTRRSNLEGILESAKGRLPAGPVDECEAAESKRDYSGEIEVFPHSSQRRYTTGSDSDRPITFALGTPQRGQMMPEVDRFAIKETPYTFRLSDLAKRCYEFSAFRLRP